MTPFELKEMKLHPCKCGSRRARLTDHGLLAFVKCPDCGAVTGHFEARTGPGEELNHCAAAITCWNAANPDEGDKPRSVTAEGAVLMEWLARAKRGEVNVVAMECSSSNGRYRLTLDWSGNYR